MGALCYPFLLIIPVSITIYDDRSQVYVILYVIQIQNRNIQNLINRYVKFLIDNILIGSDGDIYQQIAGISVGRNCTGGFYFLF